MVMFWNYEKQAKKRFEKDLKQKELAEAKACLDDRRRAEARDRRLRELEGDLIEILSRKEEKPMGLSAWISDDLFGISRNGALKIQLMKIAREEIDRKPIPIIYGTTKKKK